MQQIIIEKPYSFIPPHRGTWWSSFIQYFDLQGRYLRKTERIVDYDIRNIERFRASLDAGYGILLTPNHSRYADPLLMGWLARAARCHVYAMASWHLFHQGRFTSWAIHKMGGFSVNREGLDLKAINTAIHVLQTAERPLIIFPEGAVSRTNDRLLALMDGVAFIARSAAKRRAKHVEGGKVVVHPVAIKYYFRGDSAEVEQATDEVLTRIEQQLTWRPQRELPLLGRIGKVGHALLSLKEIEYFQETQPGDLASRLNRFINMLLHPLEREWLGEEKTGNIVPRIKAVRMKLLPEMIHNQVSAPERNRRWKHLADLYLAQQLFAYPPDYLAMNPTVERVLETVERFDEDLTDKPRAIADLHATIQIGEAIEVSPERNRSRAKVDGSDALMGQIERHLQAMLDQLALESQPYRSALTGEQQLAGAHS